MPRPRNLPPRQPLNSWGLALVVLALAWIAGYVDAVGYLELLGVYTSHMSGNTASIGRFIAQQNATLVLQHAWPLIAFVIGLIAGAALVELARRGGYQSRMSLVLAVEIILLAVLADANPTHVETTLWLGLPAIAMGMQTVTVTRVGEQRVYSTYVTGSLSKFGEALAGFAFWLLDHARHKQEPLPASGWLSTAYRDRLWRHALLNGGLWALFLTGALCGTLLQEVKGLEALWWPILGLVLLIWLDWRRPIAPVAEGEELAFET